MPSPEKDIIDRVERLLDFVTEEAHQLRAILTEIRELLESNDCRPGL